MAYFSPPKTMHLTTTLCHRITTTSPAKNHILQSLFPKPPSKNAHKTTKNTHSARPKNILEKTGLG
jgi:hypothetical protein